MNATEHEANQLKEDDDRTRDARAKRARELHQIFHGIPSLVSSPNSGIVLGDINQCWISGAFVACIFTADSHVENQLRSYIASSGSAASGRLSYPAVLRQSVELGLISDTLAARLKQLRSVRGFYDAPYPSWIEGTRRRRDMKKEEQIEDLSQRDARFAVETVAEVFRACLSYTSTLRA